MYKQSQRETTRQLPRLPRELSGRAPTTRRGAPGAPEAPETFGSSKGFPDVAAQAWRDSEARARIAGRYRDVDPAAFFGLTQGLNRSRTTLWFRLVTGHVQLNAHLQRIGVSPHNTCGKCGRERETVVHYILRCPTYANDRYRWLGSLGRDYLCLNYLFFTKGTLPALFSYIKATGRFVDTLR
jgi:hypothetical protein